MIASIAHLRIPCHADDHCCVSLASQLDRTIDCFPGLAVYVVLSDTMKARAQRKLSA